MKALLAALMIFAASPALATNYYISPTATSTACTQANPCSVSVALAKPLAAGDTIFANDGTYYSPNNYWLDMTKAGNSTAPIVWRSLNKWGATIDGRASLSQNGIRISNNNVRIENFEIKDFHETGIVNNADSSVIKGNWIHGIGRMVCDNSGTGKDGIYAYPRIDVTIDGNLIHDIGRLRRGEIRDGAGCDAGCTVDSCGHHLGPQPATCDSSCYHFNDQGIYCGGTRLSIINNIIYDVRTGWQIQLRTGTSYDVKIWGNTLVGNIVYGDQPGAIVVDVGVYGLSVRNNIFAKLGRATGWTSCAGGPTYTTTLVKATGTNWIHGAEFYNNVADTLVNALCCYA